MHNVSTIYRFNTPFLDLSTEKDNLLGVIRKIEKSVEFDGIKFNKTIKQEWNYHKIVLEFSDNMWIIEFYYISEAGNNVYHLPIFKLSIFLNNKFFIDNNSKRKTVKFLNNIFECFDWLNEKEYLIDIDNNLYYKQWFFSSRKIASYDFSNLEKIKTDFESKNGMQLLNDFIVKFQNKKYVLTPENSKEYHKLHWILLYFIYLVFLVSQNLEKSDKAKRNLTKVQTEWIYEWQVDLMKERLSYVDELNRSTLEKYKNRLELFFKMF